MFYIFNKVYNAPDYLTGKWVRFDKITSQSNGTHTFSYDNGEVLSVQPNGDWATRPAGANGVYEQGTIQGNAVAFTPGENLPYLYPVFESKSV